MPNKSLNRSGGSGFRIKRDPAKLLGGAVARSTQTLGCLAGTQDEMMERSQLLDHLVRQIIRIERPHPLRVAIDGPDAAGKTTLAQELIAPLQAYGRPVIRASIDGFHNPAHHRHRRGLASPEGYFYDSFNYSTLIEVLLAPLGPGGSRQYRSAVFDYRSESKVQTATEEAEVNAVLLFDGVFLLREELEAYWDLTVFVEADFQTTLRRAEQRDAALFGSVEEVRGRYERRYIPGQRLYFDRCRPRERANVAIDNNDPLNPEVI
jgi:uridine kinase